MLTVLPADPAPGDEVVLSAAPPLPPGARVEVSWRPPVGPATVLPSAPAPASPPGSANAVRLADLAPALCSMGCPSGLWSVTVTTSEGAAWGSASFEVRPRVEACLADEIALEASFSKAGIVATLRNRSPRAIWVPIGDALLVTCAWEREGEIGGSSSAQGPTQVLTEQMGAAIPPGGTRDVPVACGDAGGARKATLSVGPAGRYYPMGAGATPVYFASPLEVTLTR